ncbi:MAG: NUDIX domain-containing protein [Patescibacteria group bacterium]|jgi:8-oxo-dGTP pyrophosphatase MutT (NUDIX family)
MEPHRWWHAAASVWLVNAQGQIMCSKRAPGLFGNSGKWQSYFGGHVSGGSTALETVRRELEEETGIVKPADDFFLVQEKKNEEVKMHLAYYATRFDGQPSDLRFTDGEITEAKWMDMDEYWSQKEKHPDAWCNRCTLEQQAIIRQWLESTR